MKSCHFLEVTRNRTSLALSDVPYRCRCFGLYLPTGQSRPLCNVRHKRSNFVFMVDAPYAYAARSEVDDCRVWFLLGRTEFPCDLEKGLPPIRLLDESLERSVERRVYHAAKVYRSVMNQRTCYSAERKKTIRFCLVSANCP